MSVKPVLLRFKFDNFADLSSDVGQFFSAGEQTDCNGNKWDLHLHPGGDSQIDEEGWISVSLLNINEKSIDTKFIVSVKDKNGDIVRERCFEHRLTKGKGYGNSKFVKRATILDVNQDGALHFDVTIQVKDDKDDLYQPTNDDISEKMLSLLASGQGADISFRVGEQKFRAHSVILQNNAPIFANYFKQQQKNSDAIITGTTPEVFQFVLKYVYSGHLPTNDDILKWGNELINAANKYELVKMKMAIENVLVKERILNKKNVADYILFADAQSCPLLKEYAISFFVLHAPELLNSDHSKNLRDSGELLSEILTQVTSASETMTVNELRKELSKRKLDVDGSKQALLSRLEDAKRQRTE